eukprot:g5882.t1
MNSSPTSTPHTRSNGNVVRRRRSGAPSPTIRTSTRGPNLSQKTSSPIIRTTIPALSQKISTPRSNVSNLTRNTGVSRRKSPSSGSTQSVSQVRISQNNTPIHVNNNNSIFSKENLERLNEDVNDDENKFHVLLNRAVSPHWTAFYESTTGRAVYFNEVTNEQTWEKPLNAIITWVDEDSFAGEKCPNFDPENLGQDYLDTPWVKPSIEAAVHFHNRSISLNGKGSVFTPIFDMDDLGNGVQLYLYLARSMAISFWILSIVAIPMIATNIAGNRISPIHMDYFSLLKTTSLNAGDKSLPKCSSGNPSLNRVQCMLDLQKLNINGNYLFMGSAPLNIQDYTTIVSTYDLILISIFCITLLIAYLNMQSFLKGVHWGKVSTSDFAVQVWGLPPDALEDEIIDHFSDLYNLQHVDWTGRLPPENPKLYPVGHYGNSCNEYYYKKWVAEVTIVHPIGNSIRKLQKRVGIINELRIARAKAKVFSTKPSHSKLYRKADRKVQQMEWKLAKLFSEREHIIRHNFKHLDDTVCAFVIFNNIESYIRCLEDYNASQNAFYGHFLQHKKLKFMGEYPLRVFPAPDPSDVQHENLEVSDYFILKRKFISLLCTFVVLFFSVVCIVVLVAHQEAVVAKFDDIIEGTNEFCGPGITSTYFHSEIYNKTNMNSSKTLNYGKPLLSKYKVEWVARSNDPDQRLEKDRACGIGYHYLEFKAKPLDYSNSNGKQSLINMNMSHCPSYLQDLPPFQSNKAMNCINVETNNHCPCILTNSKEISEQPSCKTISCTLDPKNNQTSNLPGCSIPYTATDIVSCYCMSRIALFIEKNPSISYFSMLSATSMDDTLCNDVKNEYLMGLLGSNFIGLSINLFNEILLSLISTLVEWEHTHTISEVASTISDRASLFNVLNTGFLPIFLSWDTFHFMGENTILSSLTGLNNADKYIGFIPRWYNSIGFSVLHTMLFDSIFSYVLLGVQIIFGFFITYVRSTCCSTTAYTQKQLNDMFETPEFNVGSNLAYLKTTIALTLIYSSTMPILIPICAFNLTVYYALEKTLVVHYNKKAPKLQADVVTGVMKSFAFILILRFGVTILLLGESTVFHSTAIDYAGNDSFYYDNGLVNLFIGCCLQDHLLYHVIILLTLVVITFVLYIPDQYLPVCCQNRWHHKRDRNYAQIPSYTYIYEQIELIHTKSSCGSCCSCFKKNDIVDEENLLSQEERKNGWYIKSINKKKMTCVKRKRYTRDVIDDDDGMKHEKGEIVRTWEFLKSNGLHSYHLAKNPKYKGIIHGKMIQKTLSRKR